MPLCLEDRRAALDSRALFAAALGVCLGALFVRVAGRGQWWPLSGALAFGAGTLLNVVTQGNKSRTEHNVVFATSLLLLAYWLIAFIAGRRKRRQAS
jgi:hypothetical protein